MCRFIFLFLLGILALPSFAQENDQTPYQIALQRIEDARISGATELDLSYLDLSELPPEIGNLINLQTLHLAYNQLTSLPPEIGNLTKLEMLSLDDNQLTSLPPEFANLSNLRLLTLSNNHLRSWPTELGYLPNLQGLYSGNNPLPELPTAVRQAGLPTIQTYLRNEAWWHLQRLIAGAAGSLGLVVALILGWRWKTRHGRKEKSKRG